MNYVVSWGWCLVVGVLSVALLVMAGTAIVAVLFSVIGIARRRCRWWHPLAYLCVSIVSSLLFKLLFWVSDKLAQSDPVSAVIFWAAVLLSLIPGLHEVVRLLKLTWNETNGTPSHLHPQASA